MDHSQLSIESSDETWFLAGRVTSFSRQTLPEPGIATGVGLLSLVLGLARARAAR
ncbi:MAG TPA: hypothetical protein VMR50_09975 [Myxococcota bacterium]|nr:hypothetical protein [Myxococcota bacterium]